MKKFFRAALTALAMLATMLLCATATLRIALHTGTIEVPDLQGKTLSEASDVAIKSGLDLSVENKFYSTTIPAGRILSQAPASGSKVRKGWQLRVTESLGPQQVTIPDVTGKTVREATINIRRDSLDLGALAHLEAPGDPDIVLSQTPPPDAGVDQPRVSLLLSTTATAGANSAFVLPSFTGMSYSAANKTAAALGLRISAAGDTPAAAPALPAGAHPGPNGTMLDASNEPIALPVTPSAPSNPTGTVTNQSPDSGHRANKGDTLHLTFGHSAASTAATTPH